MGSRKREGETFVGTNRQLGRRVGGSAAAAASQEHTHTLHGGHNLDLVVGIPSR